MRDEQAKILHAIQHLAPEDVLSRAVRGQYGEGHDDGNPVPAYNAEPKVARDSQTETFVALKLSIVKRRPRSSNAHFAKRPSTI